MTQTVTMDHCVRDLMATHVFFVQEEHSIAEVLEQFENLEISGAPVINKAGQYVGVVSKTDLAKCHVIIDAIRNHLQQGKVGVTVSDVMHAGPPLTIDQDASVRDAAKLLVANRVHRLFAVDASNTIVGVISSIDLVKCLID